MLTPNQNRNVVSLAVTQSLSMNVNIINTTLVRVMLAPMASLLMSRHGHRPILIADVLCSTLSTLCLGVAAVISSFPLFCAGGMGLGAAMRIAGYYRDAAADGVIEDQRPKAISYLWAGGLAAAIL